VIAVESIVILKAMAMNSFPLIVFMANCTAVITAGSEQAVLTHLSPGGFDGHEDLSQWSTGHTSAPVSLARCGQIGGNRAESSRLQ
jgi:hypothetical protein